MAIQFHCPGCQQPIEVDQEYAGQTAACPYCRRVVSVPLQSTLSPWAAVQARPAGDVAAEGPGVAAERAGTPLPPLPTVHPASMRAAAARVYGRYGLVCAGLVAAMLVVIAGAYVMRALSKVRPGTTPTQAELRQMAEQAIEEMASSGLVVGLRIGAAFFSLVGLALGVTSLAQSRQGNWRGVVSVVVSALGALCACTALGAP